MKSYLNPNPSAVERVNKIKKKSSKVVCSKDTKKTENLSSKKSNKELFKNESEEQAWRDALSNKE